MYSTTIPNLCGRGGEWAINGATWDWGPSSRALAYDGSNDYAGLDQSIISGYPFTVLVQFKTTNSTAASRCIFSQSNSTDSGHKLGVRLNSSHHPQAFVGSTTGTFSEAANDGDWHTLGVVAEADGTCYPVYDGEIGASFSGGTFPALDLSTLGAIRSASNTEFFPGSIARLIVVQRALDVIEIQNLIRDPAAWSQPPRFELVFEPVVEEQPFFPILLPGGWPGERVSRSHPQAHHLEGWFPLTHPVDANGARSLVGNVEPAPAGNSSHISGMLSYYSFTETSGEAGDSHGSSHLTDASSVGSTSGKIGNARLFVASSSDHFTGGDVLDFEKTAPRSVAFWIKPNDISSPRELVSKKDASGNNGWGVYAAISAGSGPAFQLRGASGRDLIVRSNTVLSTSAWTHVAITFDGDYTSGGSVTIYLNGSAVSTTTDEAGLIAGDTNLNTGSLTIGARSQTTPTNYFDGILDELGIWDRELTSAEVAQLYNSGQGRSYSYLAGGGAVTHESEGRFGGRLRLDGTTSRIKYPNSPGHFHFADGESITIAAWITPDTSERRNVIMRQDGDGFGQANYAFSSGGTGFPNRLDFFFRTSESGGITHVYRSNEDYIQFGVEQHVAITLTFGDVANTIQLFYNGEPVDGSFHFGDGAGTVFSGVGDLLIGEHSSADRFDGAIADVRVYRILADATLIRNVIERPWDAIVRPSFVDLVADKFLQLGMVSDASSALAISSDRLFSFGLAAESDASLGMTVRRIYTLIQTSESDSGSQFTLGVGSIIGNPSETDVSLLVTRLKASVLALLSESDSVQAMTSSKVRSFGMTSEADTSLAVVRSKAVQLALPDEVDISQTLSRNQTIESGLVAESDNGLALDAHKVMAIGVLDEVDSTQALVTLKSSVVTMVTEADSANSIQIQDTFLVGQTTAIDSTQDISHEKTLTLGNLEETDSGQSIGGLRIVALSLPQETDSSQPVSISKISSIGMPEEADSSLALQSDRVVAFTMASELASGLVIERLREYAIEETLESDSANDWTAVKIRDVGIASEVSVSFIVTPTGVFILGLEFSAIGTHMDASAPQQSMDVSANRWSR